MSFLGRSVKTTCCVLLCGSSDLQADCLLQLHIYRTCDRVVSIFLLNKAHKCFFPKCQTIPLTKMERPVSLNCGKKTLLFQFNIKFSLDSQLNWLQGSILNTASQTGPKVPMINIKLHMATLHKVHTDSRIY